MYQTKKQFSLRKGRKQHVCTVSGVISKKRRGHLDFCSDKVQKKRHCLVITEFQYGIDFWRCNLLNIEHTQVRYSYFCAKNCTGVPWSTWNRAVQDKNITFRPVKTPACFWPVVGRDTFLPLAPVLGPQPEETAMAPSLAVDGGQHDTQCVPFE